jgi:hypothetical protein
VLALLCHGMLQGIGLLDCVNERDVPPIPPLFLARPNLVVNGDTVLQKLKDRPDGMFLDRLVKRCPALGAEHDGRVQSVPCRHGKLRRREQRCRHRSGCPQQRGQQLEPAAAAEQQGVAVWKRQHQQDSATGAHFVVAAGLRRTIALTPLQGTLGNCWFLSALGVVASRPQLLRQVLCVAWHVLLLARDCDAHRVQLFSRFGSSAGTTVEQLMQMGVFTLQFYKDCLWHVVTVDSFLPCRVMPVNGVGVNGNSHGAGDGDGASGARSSSV